MMILLYIIIEAGGHLSLKACAALTARCVTGNDKNTCFCARHLLALTTYEFEAGHTHTL